MFPSPECTVRWLQICLKTGTRGASECMGRAEKPPRKARGNPGPAGRLLGTGRRCPSASWALRFGSQETCGRGQEGQGGDPILSRKANCSFLGRKEAGGVRRPPALPTHSETRAAASPSAIPLAEGRGTRLWHWPGHVRWRCGLARPHVPTPAWRAVGRAWHAVGAQPLRGPSSAPSAPRDLFRV